MGKFIDLTGQRFGRLTVIERDTSRKDKVYWWCKCDCGNTKSIRAAHLRSKAIKSCGCLNLENLTTHGASNTKLYQVWAVIKERCLNPRCANYKNYGGRGITICDEWRNDFQTFFDYVSKLEHFGEEGYTIDRINNNGNYEPGNVRWATKIEQSNNLRSNHLVEINGEQISLAEAKRLTGRGRETIVRRLAKNVTIDQLFSEKPITTRYFEIDGRLWTIKDIAQATGLCYSTIYDRVQRGLTGADLVAPVKR